MTEFIFRKYKNEDKEQVLNLLGNALWHFPQEERVAYFDWKYEQNPYTDSPLGFVCLDGEKIIAFRGYMLQPLSIAGKIYYNAALADTVTDSSYRRMGLFSRITKFSLEELEKDPQIFVSTNSSSGGPTLNGYLKLGWIPLTERGHLFSFTWRSLFPKHQNSSNYSYTKRNTQVVLTTECRATEIGNLALSKNPMNLISVYTDEKYVGWRYANPNAKYFFAYFYQDEKLKAYIVLKKIAERKYDIVDYQCEEKRMLKTLLSKTHRWLNPMYILNWIVNHNDIKTKEHSMGFVNLDFILNRISKFKTPPFLIRTTKTFQNEQDWTIDGKVDMKNIANWNLNKVVADEI